MDVLTGAALGLFVMALCLWLIHRSTLRNRRSRLNTAAACLAATGFGGLAMIPAVDSESLVMVTCALIVVGVVLLAVSA